MPDSSYNPDQPRDNSGKWTSGGSGPTYNSDEEQLAANAGGKPSSNEFSALHDYTEYGYHGINDDLRNGRTPKETATLDAVIARGHTSEDIIVYRGIGEKDPIGKLDAAELGKLKGTEFSDKGYVSTTLRRGLAADFSFGTVLEVHIPAGTRLAYIPALRHAAGVEKEILLGRGHTFRIEGVHANAMRHEGQPYDILHVRLVH